MKKSGRRQQGERRQFSLQTLLPAFLRKNEERRKTRRRTRLLDRRWVRKVQGLFVRAQTEGVVGLTMQEDGFGLAQVVQRGPDQTPLIKACTFIPSSPAAGDGTDFATVTQVVRGFGLEKNPFVCLLFPDQYTVFPAEAPKVPREELATAIRWRIKDRLDYSVQEAVVDVFDLPPTGSGAESDMVYVVATKSDAVREKVDLFIDAKLDLKAIDILEFSLRNLTTLAPDDQEGMGLLFLGRADGLVLVTRAGNLFLARPIDYGLDQLLESVDGRANVEATELVGSFVLDTIALEIQRTMDYYESHFQQAPVGSVHIAPLTVPFPGLQSALSEKLGIRIKDYPFRQLLEFGADVDELDLARCLPAIGAALRKGEGA